MSSEAAENDEAVLKIDQQATPAERKQQADDLIAKGVSALPPLALSLEEFYTSLPVESADGTIWQSPTKVVRPKLAHDSGMPRPLIVYFYGGGFVVGNPDLVTSPAREWAEGFHATVVLPSYRLTPSVRYPVPMTDAVSVVKTIASGCTLGSHPSFFGANPKDGFVVGGISAGAVVAAVVTGLTSFGDDTQHKLQVPLTGVFLCAPWFFRSETVPDEYRPIWTAMKDNANVEGFTSADMDAVYDSLQVTDAKSPLLTPAAFFQEGKRPEDKGWPPTYFQACQYDPLRDDAIVFEKMLAGIGTKSRIRLFPDDVHAGMSVLPFIHKSKNPTIEEDTISGMAWLLEHD